jgi:3-hydroxyanthranilate 3,4-dioxygenase
MLLKVVDDGVFRDILIPEGSMFLLPPNTPHSPVRFAHTVGIVLEQQRPADSVDRLRWYCANCKSVVEEAAFHGPDLGTQIKEVVNGFRDSEERRTCKKCGTLAKAAPAEGEIPDPNLASTAE